MRRPSFRAKALAWFHDRNRREAQRAEVTAIARQYNQKWRDPVAARAAARAALGLKPQVPRAYRYQGGPVS